MPSWQRATSPALRMCGPSPPPCPFAASSQRPFAINLAEQRRVYAVRIRVCARRMLCAHMRALALAASLQVLCAHMRALARAASLQVLCARRMLCAYACARADRKTTVFRQSNARVLCACMLCTCVCARRVLCAHMRVRTPCAVCIHACAVCARRVLCAHAVCCAHMRVFALRAAAVCQDPLSLLSLPLLLPSHSSRIYPPLPSHSPLPPQTR